MQAHEERVVHERLELVEKLDKLNVFINSRVFVFDLTSEEQARLVKQANIMCQYADILYERIVAFSK